MSIYKEDIFVSVVMPCLNEQQSIGICIKKAREVLETLNLKGEVIVVDNGSTDKSVTVSQDAGAKVIFEPEKGYGSAYLRGFQEAKGNYLVMGDSDNTYDFSEMSKFLDLLKDGYDFVIGSRFKGKILKGAMPWLNRYIGNPVLTGFLKLFFHTQISDAHCGMRAFIREAYDLMGLRTKGMEFASEMIVNALREKLKITEVPITYYPRQGESKLVPFKDAWRHMRFMLLYSPTYLFLIPGIVLLSVGIILVTIFLKGPVTILGHLYDIHPMVIGSLLSILGFQVLTLGIYARTYALLEGFTKEDKFLAFFYRHFNLEKGIGIGMVIFVIGLFIVMHIFYKWFISGLGPLNEVRRGLFALTFVVIGINIIFSSFFLSILGIGRKK